MRISYKRNTSPLYAVASTKAPKRANGRFNGERIKKHEAYHKAAPVVVHPASWYPASRPLGNKVNIAFIKGG